MTADELVSASDAHPNAHPAQRLGT